METVICRCPGCHKVWEAHGHRGDGDFVALSHHELTCPQCGDIFDSPTNEGTN